MRVRATKVHGEHVLAGTARTPAGHAAVAYAAQEAAARSVPLELVHVVPADLPLGPPWVEQEGTLQQYGAAILDECRVMAARAAPDVEVTTILLSGPRADVLVEAAEDAEVLVLGSPPASTFERVRTGSTADEVTRRARCPVVLVPAAGQSGQRQGRVVVGVGDLDGAGGLLESALEQADLRRSELLVVHARPHDEGAQQGATSWTERATRLLADVASQRSLQDVSARVREVDGAPSEALVDAAGDADLLVMARTPHPAGHHHIGRTIRAALRSAGCPVMVVSSPRDHVRREARTGTGPVL